LASFVKRWLGQSRPVEPLAPAGQRIYCIGDIHGRLDLLSQLHARIAEDACTYPGRKMLIYLGDYIDRGEQSREVVDLLLANPLRGFELVYMLGNHEQTLLDFLRHPRAVASWLTYGGRATLRSYGVTAADQPGPPDLEHIRDQLALRLPPAHRDFYQQLQLFHIAGHYCFVHAGIRPGIALAQQRNEDLLWIRGDFTNSQQIHEHIIVHGHTIAEQVEILPNRIGIDTGAFQSGILTCLVLEDAHQRLLQTGAGTVV